MSLDSFGVRQELAVGGGRAGYFYSLKRAEGSLGKDISRLPFSLKVLLENLLRNEDGKSVTDEHIRGLSDWLSSGGKSGMEIAYRPSRVLMQDFTGVPAVADLAAMRDKVADLKGDVGSINPQIRVDLVIDHSVIVDRFGDEQSYQHNIEKEFERNRERYEFLRWGQHSFDNFRVVPPGTGICHQVNLEYLSEVVWRGGRDNNTLYLDTVIGTDSHTTMVNALGVLAWGVGGIEAEAAMLGQPISMKIPEVIGVELKGGLREGITATDLVLVITNMLREYGVVGKFVEFFGEGLQSLSLADRATISNMAPEYGATCGMFAVDEETLRYLELTARSSELIELVSVYMKEQGMWGSDTSGLETIYTDRLELDISGVEATLAGPKRPQDKILLGDVSESFRELISGSGGGSGGEVLTTDTDNVKVGNVESKDRELSDGDIVIAAITSCTNTSNPNVLLSAGLLAKAAVERGLSVPRWVKTSFAPGSQVVTDYLNKSGLSVYLSELGFDLVGYGCTTCIGNSGPIAEDISSVIRSKNLTVAAVLSGNRNFEGRVHALVKANYLASPPLVVAYALAGRVGLDLVNEPIGYDHDGVAVYLRDIWPSNDQINRVASRSISREMFADRYGNVFDGGEEWQAIKCSPNLNYDWNSGSTYIRRPPFFDEMTMKIEHKHDIENARALLILGDSVTTDHISPAGAFGRETPAGNYLMDFQVRPSEFNSYGSRRGNHELMLRGTFANVRIRNQVAPGTEGGVTRYYPSGEEMSVFDASLRYANEGVPLIVIGGREYGTGSSRDWAAKGTKLLGVRAVIAQSFERIHRSNLVGMGILPLQFTDGVSGETLKLKGDETFSIIGIDRVEPRSSLQLEIIKSNGDREEVELLVRIDTGDELLYFRNDGILPYVLRDLMGREGDLTHRNK